MAGLFDDLLPASKVASSGDFGLFSDLVKEFPDAPAPSNRQFSLPQPIDLFGLNTGARVTRSGSVLDNVQLVDPQGNARALANAVKNNPDLVNSPMYRTGANVLMPQQNAVQNAMRRNLQDQAGQQRKQHTITAARAQTDAAFGESPAAQAAIAPFRRMTSGIASTVGALAGVPQLFGSDLGRETSEAMSLMAAAHMPAEPGIADEIAAGLGQVGPMAGGGQLLRAGLTRLLGEKAALSAAGTVMGAAGGTLSGNQVLNDLEFRSDLSEQEKQARAQGASILSAVIGRHSDRFLLPGMKGGTGGAVRPIAGAFATQGGEEVADTLAQNYLTDRPVTEGALRAGLVGGATGALVRSAGVTAERQAPESIIAQIIEQAASQPEPAYRMAQGMTDAANTASVKKQNRPFSGAQPALSATNSVAIPALPYDPSVQNKQTLIADAQGNVRPEDSAEAFYRQQQAEQDAEMGLTPDVRKAQEARQMSANEFLDAPFEPKSTNVGIPQDGGGYSKSTTEPELLQMLRRTGWMPQQEVFNQKPDLTPEQAQQLESALADDVQAEFNNDLKTEIRGRLGIEPRAEDPAPDSYAQNPLLRLIANEGGMNIAERSDFNVDPKRLTKSGRTMPVPYNIAGKPLFRQDGLQGDMLVEKLQQFGYLTQEQIDQADANSSGGSYQLAYDMVSKAIQDPQSIGLDAQDTITRRAKNDQAKRLESDAGRFGIDTRGMGERQIANQINRVQRRAEQPATPDFQTRKMSRIEDVETARGRAMAEKLDRLDKIAAFRDLDVIEQSRFAQIFFEEDGANYIVKRTEIDQNEAYDEYYATLEATRARTDLGSDQGLAAREPQENPKGGTRSSANDEPRSAGTDAQTGQDSDQALSKSNKGLRFERSKRRLLAARSGQPNALGKLESYTALKAEIEESAKTSEEAKSFLEWINDNEANIALRNRQSNGLTSYTEAEVRQREQRAANEARKQERERIKQERNAEADAQRGEFTLTGSDRAADQGAARGQNALFTVDSRADIIEVDGEKKSILQTVAQYSQAESAAIRAATNKSHEIERADRIGQEYQKEYDNQNTVDGKEIDDSGVARDEDGDITDEGYQQMTQRAEAAIDAAVDSDMKPIKSLDDIDRYAGHRAARDAAKAYLEAAGVPYQEPRSAGSRYLEISSKNEDVNETLKLRFATHETQSRQHTITQHNWVAGNRNNDIGNMLQSAIDFHKGATGVGENINFSVSQPSSTLSNFRKLTGDYSASTAKADAEQMLGIDSPVTVLPKADYGLAEKGVPMWYDLDDQKIYYNTAFKDRDRADDAQYMVEEIMHAIDHTGGNNTLSLSGGRFNEGGDIRTEIEAAYERSQIFKKQLRYPLEYNFTDDRKAVELFARIAVIYRGFPEALQAAAPKTYEVYREIFESLRAVPETISGQLPTGNSSRDNGDGNVGRGRGQTDTGDARGQADQRLERFRESVARATQGERGGRTGDFGDSKLEARAPWHVPDPTRLDDIRRNWQDNKIDIRKTVEAIKNHGATIADDANPYLRDELYIGRVRDQLDKLADESVTPLLRAIANSAIKPETVNRYLWARHAKERNQQMAKVNGDTFTDDLNYAGMSTADARAELAKLASTPDYAKLQKIAAMVDDISRDTRTKIVIDGLEDAAVIKAWEGAYKFYVPLQRDVEESGKRGQGYNVKGSEARRAVGSDKDATNILANVIAQAESAIIRSEKATVGRSVLELAKQNPNPDFWQVDKPPTERVIDHRTGMVTVKPVSNYKNMDNVFVVKEAGKERFVVFNEKNKRAMEFARNLKNLDAGEIGSITETVGKGTRYLSQWVTARNPLFWMTNFVRDVQGVAFNLQSTPLKGQAPKVMARIPMALAGVTQAKQGKGGKYAKYSEEFKTAGGQTGYMQSYENSLERMEEVTKEIDRIGQKAYDPRKVGRALLDVIDGANDVIENGVRLAVYVQAREQGISEDQSASIAKNISVNFNRKGNKTAVMNSWYMFANANIQGNVRMIEGIATSKRSQVAAGLLATAGAALATLAYYSGGDDEESRKKRYELVPAFERERNLILFYPNSEKYLKVPLPLGPHLLFNAGRLAAEVAIEENPSAIEKSASFASSILSAFNPIGGGLPSADAKGVVQAATPTILRPVVDTVVNQNFAGTPIAKQDFPGSKTKPGYMQAKDNTPKYWTSASKALNDLSGGDNIKPGSVNIKPETLAYLLKGYAVPGIAQTVDKAAGQAASSKPVDWVDRPGVSKFVGRVDEGNRNRAAYETRRADEEKASQYEAYLKAGERPKAVALIKEWGNGDMAKGRKLYSQTEAVNKQEAQIAREKREARKLPDEKRDAAMQRIDERRNRINAVYLRNRSNIIEAE